MEKENNSRYSLFMQRLGQFSIFLVWCLCMLAGCSGRQSFPLPLQQKEKEVRISAVEMDPKGAIPAPSLPPQLAAYARQTHTPETSADTAAESQISYAIVCSVLPEVGVSPRSAVAVSQKNATTPSQNNTTTSSASTSGSTSGSTSPNASSPQKIAPEHAALLDTFERVNTLHRMQDTPPSTLVTLEQRLRVALKEGEDVLHAHGYYVGKVQGKVVTTQQTPDAASGEKVSKPLATIQFLPGPQYRMGRTRIFTTPPLPRETAEKNARGRTPRVLPRTFSDVGMEEGAPALAEKALAAVDRIREEFLDQGYPFAQITQTKFVVDHKTQSLEAYVHVTQGAFVRMGEIEQRGNSAINNSYLVNQRMWRPGSPWRQSRVEAYQNALRRSGLFQTITVAPGEGSEETRPVVVTVDKTPERTFGGALKYHSDFGPGVLGYWEDRNLTNNGDKVRIEAPVWTDMQEVTARYRLPFFLSRRQNAIAKGGFLHQDTDAYEIQSASGAAGIERRLSRSWSGTVQGSAEGGFIKDPNKPKRDYRMFGIPLGLTYDTTHSLLDALDGIRLFLSLAPYTGDYAGDFSVVRSRVDAHAFFTPADNEKVTLAFRGALGNVSGAKSQQIPPSVRFYSGGGGSVRGYEYQSIGPRNEDKDPMGGTNLVEMSGEARWKLGESWGIVTFIDGGMVYSDVNDGMKEDILWGAGLGFRYYTAIGPLRFDVATPLNPRSDDDALQFYISIGQSF